MFLEGMPFKPRPQLKADVSIEIVNYRVPTSSRRSDNCRVSVYQFRLFTVHTCPSALRILQYSISCALLDASVTPRSRTADATSTAQLMSACLVYASDLHSFWHCLVTSLCVSARFATCGSLREPPTMRASLHHYTFNLGTRNGYVH